jgi:sarcosine oxidase subunit beta
MIPGLEAYAGHLPKLVADGGYYTKTRKNRPLIGALSGFGVMAGCAAGELLAGHLTGSALPSYASAFLLERYQNPEYQKKSWHPGTTRGKFDCHSL